jgi:hypothetical protein
LVLAVPAQIAQMRSAYPQLAQLLDLYQREYQGDDARRIFENAVERRLLLNCRDACPTCLDEGPGCQVDQPSLSRLTLSRVLLLNALDNVRRARVVPCAGDVPAVVETIVRLFEQDAVSPVVLTAPTNTPERLAAVLSYLTDYGIEERLERRYPRVDRERQVGPETWLSLSLERAL